MSTLQLRVHKAILDAAVASTAAVDAFRYRKLETPSLRDKATICVKTFERPETIERFVRMARKVFDGRIVVADDSKVPWRSDDPLVDVLELPFNSGVSHGRNAALAEVDTPYVIITDDDLVFTKATHWINSIHYLEQHPEVDAVAATLVELPKWYSVSTDSAELKAGHAPPKIPFGTMIGGLAVQRKTPQIYLARADSIRRVGWDPDLRMVDHSDFFSRASGTLVFVQSPTPVYHSRTPWNATFEKHRADTENDFKVLSRKWARRSAEGCPVRPLPDPLD